MHEAKACYFEVGTKLDGNGKDNKRELLEKHSTDLFFFLIDSNLHLCLLISKWLCILGYVNIALG